MPAGALEIGLIGRLHGDRSWEPENRLLDVDLDDFDATLRIDGDVETCRRKLEAYAAVGIDRLVCLMQVGHLEHAQALKSIRTAGKFLVPELMG